MTYYDPIHSTLPALQPRCDLPRILTAVGFQARFTVLREILSVF